MEVGENSVRVFYGTEKREGERLEIYTGGISPFWEWYEGLACKLI